MKSFDYISECFEYDQDTGFLYWKVRPEKHFKHRLDHKAWNSKYAGSIISSFDKDGYILVMLSGTRYKAHRIIWLLNNKEWPPGKIDHINSIRHDNRLSNLRCASSMQNSHNAVLCKRNTSGYKGVSFHLASGKWRASISAMHRQIHIGLFDNVLDAVEAVRECRESVHGEYANHG